MVSFAELAAAIIIPLAGLLSGLWKYLHQPKATAERVDEIDSRLEQVEGAVREMQQLLTGADSTDADPGILIELQDSIHEVRTELSEIRREIENQNDNN